MVKLAVTGGIACGKTAVSAWMMRQNMEVCDADVIAHELMRSGTAVFGAVVEEFGRGVVGADGELDRSVLGRVVFGDPLLLRRLGEIVHPSVRARWGEWLESRRSGVAVVVVPLLYECGEGAGWDAVLCVGCSQERQLERLAARGLNRRDAMARIRSQMPIEEKMVRADRVIWNDGDLSLLDEQMKAIVGEISGCVYGF